MMSGVVISGASVTSVRPPRSEVSSSSALVIELAQLRRVVHSLARDVEEGALDVDAEDPGHARLQRAAHRGDGARDDVEVGADQRGQKAGGTEAAMGAADGADRLDARRVVEQHPAAAVHLRVDEARQQQAAAEIAALRAAAARVGRGDDVEDAPVVDQHAAAVREALLAQHAPVHQCDAHQSVSVTLLRFGG